MLIIIIKESFYDKKIFIVSSLIKYYEQIQSIKNPNILEIIDIIHEKDKYYIVIEYCEESINVYYLRGKFKKTT